MAPKPPTRSPKLNSSKPRGKVNGTKPSGVKKPSSRSKTNLGKQVKTKPTSQKGQPKKERKSKKVKIYTDKQLNLPSLNMITPVNVQSSKSSSTNAGTGKKHKTFVDDQESMMTILAMVNAEKEGQIESKMIKARQLEEIREARRKEAEAKEKLRRGKLEGVMEDLKNKKKMKKVKGDERVVNGGGANGSAGVDREVENMEGQDKRKKKRVSFA